MWLQRSVRKPRGQDVPVADLAATLTAMKPQLKVRLVERLARRIAEASGEERAFFADGSERHFSLNEKAFKAFAAKLSNLELKLLADRSVDWRSHGLVLNTISRRKARGVLSSRRYFEAPEKLRRPPPRLLAKAPIRQAWRTPTRPPAQATPFPPRVTTPSWARDLDRRAGYDDREVRRDVSPGLAPARPRKDRQRMGVTTSMARAPGGLAASAAGWLFLAAISCAMLALMGWHLYFKVHGPW